MDPFQPAAEELEIPRELAENLSLRSHHALVLTGVRRSGKSVLLSQFIRQRSQSFFCNFEDTRLFGFSPADFPQFLDLTQELAPGKTIIFLDEVQEVPQWQRLVRALLDRGRTVCLTGSNASLLGRELGSKLTGRQLTFEVFPFSYTEYLNFRKLKPGSESLLEYLDDGGFPTYLTSREPRILQELFRDVVRRDIAGRHELRETRHVFHLALYLLANTGQALSMQKLTKTLAIPTVGQTSHYLEYLQDAYLIFALPRFSASFKQRVVAPNKYYAVDNGLRRRNTPQTNPDIGHRLENAIFLALRKTSTGVHYAVEKDLWECDFVTNSAAIQVCAELTAFNRERELRGVFAGMQLPGGKRKGLILTLNQRDRYLFQGASIDVIPAWEWLSK